MDRRELRFRILFEYYQEFHSENPATYDANAKIKNIEIPEHEKRSAQSWLIDERYVEGSNNSFSTSPVPFPYIGRINSYGINYIERVMGAVFTKIEDNVSDINELTQIEKIDRFIKKCLNNEAVRHICRITLEAITTCMTFSESI